MGLISRVSSRTYRRTYPKWFSLNTSKLAELFSFHPRKLSSPSLMLSTKTTSSSIAQPRTLDKKINMNNIQLTKFKLEFLFGAKTSTVKKAWEAADMSAKWAETAWAKKIVKKSLRANLGDFDRFKVMKLKQQRRHIIQNTKA